MDSLHMMSNQNHQQAKVATAEDLHASPKKPVQHDCLSDDQDETEESGHKLVFNFGSYTKAILQGKCENFYCVWIKLPDLEFKLTSLLVDEINNSYLCV